MNNDKGGENLVDSKEQPEIKKEAEEISRELSCVFETHFKELIRTEEKLQEIVYDIAFKTLICKANRDKDKA